MEHKQLLLFIKTVQRRVFFCNIIKLLFCYLGIGLGIGILINGISLFVPIYGAQKAAVGAVILFAILGVFHGIFCFPQKEKAAALIDAKGMAERTLTALENIDNDSEIACLQRRDTLRKLNGFSVKENFPVVWDLKKNLIVLGLLGVFTALAFLPSEARQEAVAQHELKEEIKEEVKKAEELKNLLDTRADLQKLLKAAEKMELKSQIDRAIQELSKASDKKELAKAKTRLEKKLEQALPGLTRDGFALAEQENVMSGQDKAGIADAREDMQDGSQGTEGQKSSGQGTEGQKSSGQGNNGQEGKGGQGSSNQKGTGKKGNGGGYNYGNRQGVEKADKGNKGEPEKITIPGRTMGTDKNVTGSGNDGSSSYTKGTQEEGFYGEQVEYGTVLGEYSQKAYSRLQEGSIPAGMENVVKNYFDGLNE